MTESSDSATRLRADFSPARRRRRQCLPAVVVCLLLVLVLAAIALILAFTVFRVRDPTTQLVSARVSGISPRVDIPALRVQINVTVNLVILVHNPNRAAFAHALGQTQLYYRGVQVGFADVEPGRISARGSEDVRVAMTVEADQFASALASLVADVMAGQVGLDASTRIPGRVNFLRVFKHHAVAVSECHVVVGFPDLRVRSQECTQKTKL